MKKYLLLFVALIMLLGTACEDALDIRTKSLTTRTSSTEFVTYDEKIAFLKTYFNCPSEIIDAGYHINYLDNGTGLFPIGPSEWQYSIAVKINPDDIHLWIEDAEEVEESELNTLWWIEPNIQDWPLEGPVTYYKHRHQYHTIVYEEQGILLVHIFAI